MVWSLVTERKTGQIVFGRDSNVPLMLDSLWSPVSHNYILQWVWDARELTNDNLLFFRVEWGSVPKLVKFTPDNLEELRFNQRRGDLLQHVKRAVEKNRRPFSKNLEGQDEVYRMKVDEAQRALSQGQDSTAFPLLEADALLSGISIENAATLVMMKHLQQKQVLIDTEKHRRVWIKQILEATKPEHLIPIQNDLTAYERSS